MTVKPLTNAEVKNAKAQAKDYSIFDGFGLLLYVSSTGGKTWRFRYIHPVTARRRTYTIGRFPEYTLAEAREERERLRKLVARGIDPSEVKKEQKADKLREHAQTFAFISSKWLEMKESENLRENTRILNAAIVRNLNELFGKEPIKKIKAASTIEALKSYADRPAMRSKMVMCVSTIMDFAANSGVIDINPLARIYKAFPSVKNTRIPTLGKTEFPAFLDFWNALDVSVPIKLSLKFQIATMVRPMEAAQASWVEIDLEKALWTIPAERMKAKREHIVPLSTMALKILADAKQWKREESNFVFPSLIRSAKPISRTAATLNIIKSTYNKRVSPHGFRALASTVLNEEGFHPDVIEAALAHKSGNNIRDIYNRTTYLEQRKTMMQWWGEFIEAAERGEILETTGDKGLRLVC